MFWRELLLQTPARNMMSKENNNKINMNREEKLEDYQSISDH
jgi:hypothetical protein